jgi:Tfp pilus assembly protein PilN
MPNLARQPFVNRRPVARVALLLTLFGALLLVVNLWLYVSYARTRSANATQLVAVEQRIAAETERLQSASSALTEADVEQQNELVTYLNSRIEERTFAWSVLFDRLSELLPGKVRLLTLTPSFQAADERRSDRRASVAEPQRRVNLSIQGAAKDGEAILELVDALFAHPAFEQPNLTQETSQQGEIDFSLTVRYLPHVAADDGEGEDGEDPGAGAGETAGDEEEVA